MKEYHKIQSLYKRHPNTHRLTDEFSLPEFRYLRKATWTFTEKIDGTNICLYWDGEKLTLHGRTENSQIPTILANKLYSRFDHQKSVLSDIFDKTHVHLYCEGYGAGIQTGASYRDDQDAILFDVLLGDSYWMPRDDIDALANNLGITSVPILGFGNLDDMEMIVGAGLQSTIGMCSAEGIVARTEVELSSPNGRMITKLKYSDYTKRLRDNL